MTACAHSIGVLQLFHFLQVIVFYSFTVIFLSKRHVTKLLRPLVKQWDMGTIFLVLLTLIDASVDR